MARPSLTRACSLHTQAALLKGRLSYTLDSEASLFLNAHGIRKKDLTRVGGRIAYAPTGRVPCMLHSNGLHRELFARLWWQVPKVAWIVDPTCVKTDHCLADGRDDSGEFCCVNCTANEGDSGAGHRAAEACRKRSRRAHSHDPPAVRLRASKRGP